MAVMCDMTQEILQRNDLIHLDFSSNQNYESFRQKDDLLTPTIDEGYSSLSSNSDSDNPTDVLKKYVDLLTPSNDEGFSSLSSSSDSNHSNGSLMQYYAEAQRRTSEAQHLNSNFNRQLSHSEASDGNPPRIRKLLAEVSQRTEELLRENAQTLQKPEDNQSTATAICELFYHRGLYENHFVTGEDIVSVLKFLAGVALHKNIINEKQEKRVNILSSAVAKECGFSTHVSIYPLVCIPLQSKIFNKSANHNHPPSGQIFLSKLLRLQKNSKSPVVYLDETGRVYTSTSDWVRTNHFQPSLVYYPQKIIIDDDIQRLPFRLREVTTPSCQTSKKALKAVDVIIGLSAVTAGAVCIATGGLALPIAGAAQLVASLYLGARSTAAIVDNQRHRPKSHNK